MVAKTRTSQESSKRTYSITWYRTHFRIVSLFKNKVTRNVCYVLEKQTKLHRFCEVSITKRDIVKMDSWVLLSWWVCSHQYSQKNRDEGGKGIEKENFSFGNQGDRYKTYRTSEFYVPNSQVRHGKNIFNVSLFESKPQCFYWEFSFWFCYLESVCGTKDYWCY